MIRTSPGERRVAIFDLGGVLVDWNPRHLYRTLFAGDDAAMEEFLATVCTPSWNACQDAGRSFDDAIRALMPQHEDKRELIEAWRKRFDEMIPAAIDGTVTILSELRALGVPLYALTNFSAETFPRQRERFEFLGWFRGIVVSGAEGVIKPDPRIFQVLFERYGVAPGDAAFIDDVQENAAAASALGLRGIHFRSPEDLRGELARCGLLPETR